MFKKIVLIVGLILIVTTALLIGNFSDATTFLVVLGLLGIFVVGAFFPKQKEKMASIV